MLSVLAHRMPNLVDSHQKCFGAQFEIIFCAIPRVSRHRWLEAFELGGPVFAKAWGDKICSKNEPTVGKPL